MELINAGILSVLPPIIAIVLALITKEVISSLIVGILSGAVIYTAHTGGSFLVRPVEVTFSVMGSWFDIQIILFLALLGALVTVVTMAGGSRAYGQWAGTKIKSRTSAQLATSALGALIFIDDYFNCLTVGTVMKPVTDKYRISRAKLAYIVDATAAPICIIAPISSWAAAVGASLYKTGSFENELSAFVKTIPYNLYAILTIIMVIVLAFTNLDFGPMAKAERQAREGHLGSIETDATVGVKVSDKGRVFDLLIPIGALILFSILAMLYTGGFFSGEGISIATAFGNCESTLSLVMGGFGALIVSFLLFIPRKVVSFRNFMTGITEGVKSMVPAFIILTLAWTIAGICRDLLGTGEYVGNLVQQSQFPMALLPAIIFLVAAFLSFSTGTAWGTFNILIPIVVIICQGSPELITVTLSATLAGSVFGDHSSPISDTTILSSTGAGCDHIQHVSTQFIYAMVVAGCCFVGYLVAGFSGSNLIATLGSSLVLLVAALVVLHKVYQKKGDPAPKKA